MNEPLEPAPALPDPSPSPELDATRRGFLAAATCAVATCAGAAVLGPAVLAVVSPASGGIVRLGDGTLDLGPLNAYEEGVPKKAIVRGARTDAYVKFGERSLGSVLVVRRGDKVVVFSAVCPHAGCEVSPKESELFCPCHESRFGLDGAKIAGPTPRGLDPLDAKVEGGRVRVRFERFVIGTPERKSV